MAINLSSGDSSPRYSFSNDLPQNNPNQIQEQVHLDRLDMSLLSSSSSSEPKFDNFEFDFNFCVTAAAFPEPESFPADDLFYNGVIIPTQMKQKLISIQQEEEVTSVTTATIIREEKTSLKSFWRFRRSSSLNCENYGHKKSSSSTWSMPLLFRSKSTGSSSASSNDNNNPKQTHKNYSTSNNGKSMNTTTNDQNVRYSTSSSPKPPLKKSGSGGGGSYNSVNGGVRNCGSSALNVVPPPYITKGTSDLLGFTSLFRNGIRDKKTKN